MKTFREFLTEAPKFGKTFSTSTDASKLNDDDLVDFYSWLENMKDPSADNKDARARAIKAAIAEMKKRDIM